MNDIKEVIKKVVKAGVPKNIINERGNGFFINNSANTQYIEVNGKNRIKICSVGGSSFSYPQINTVDKLLKAIPHIMMTAEQVSIAQRRLVAEIASTNKQKNVDKKRENEEYTR